MKRVLFFLMLFVPGLIIAGTVTFNRTFGGIENDFAHAVQQTADGGYIVCGQTDSYGLGTNLKPDMWIIKLDKSGNKEWDKTYGGRESDIAFAVQQTTDMGFIVAGTTSSFGKGYTSIWIIKLDIRGDSVWSAFFEGSMVSSAHSVMQTSDGGYILAGKGKENILKLDANGRKEWGRRYGWIFYAVEQTNDGGYIAAGDSIFKPQEWNYTPSLTLIKLDREGNKEWSNPLGNSFLGSAFSVHQTSDGGYVFSGDSIAEKSAFDHSHYGLSVKLDAEGKIIWKHFGPEYSAAQSIYQTSDEGYVASGNTLDDDHGLNFWIVQLDKNGREKWQKSYGSISQWEYASSIRQTSDGGYIVAGQTESAGAGRYDMWILKLDENGELGTTGVFDPDSNNQDGLLLLQNYPNPFSQSTTITFNLPKPDIVTLMVYDISGKETGILIKGHFPAGKSEVTWIPEDQPGGVYICRFQTSNIIRTKNLVYSRKK